ncbi:outer membrane protein assembly factor BamB family protein [Catenulispora rubra]|uniref:outer membrane protein assembly factor BamB family protein n=1 Tax=Catenulispora rubra TaxID=280293 RepID=UPI00189235AC|nr:PQQ-binding-like beta-propeller repeat protein [Catenulispora rubra]
MRGDDGYGSESKKDSVLGLAGVGVGVGAGDKRMRPITRRAILFGIPAVSVTGAVALGVAAEHSENARHQRALNPPVNPGPATVRTPGTLAGPAAAPGWSVTVSSSVRAIAMAAGTVVLVDRFGNVRGYDPQTGVEKWQPSVVFFVNIEAPLMVVGDTLYGYDADGDVLAVDATDGTLRWKVQIGTSGVDIATVQGSAGSLVFSTGSIEGQGGVGAGVVGGGGAMHGKLWAVDTAGHGVAWTVDGLDYNLAVAASEPAGVVATADEIAYRLTAYSLKDRSVVWHRDTGNAESIGLPISPAACLTVSGSTFYWGADKLYALDAATGTVRWSADGPNPADEFQSVVVLAGQGAGDADLVVATTTGAGGGTLSAFDAATGVTRWVQRGSAKFGDKTSLTAATGTGAAGVLYAAEDDSGSLFAVDAKTGQTRWTYHDAAATADLVWTVAADDARVYVAYGKNLMAFEH